MKRPLVGITVAFCLGIFIASKIKLFFFWVYIFAFFLAIAAIFFLKKEKVFWALLFFLSFLLGVLLLTNSYILPKNHILKFVPFKGTSVYIEGIVDSDPMLSSSKVSFVLKVEKLKIDKVAYKVCGKVLVKISRSEGFFYGDRLILEGRLSKPFYFPISGKLNYRDYLKYKGIYVILNVSKNSRIKKIKSRQGNPMVYFIFKLRQRLKDTVNHNLSPLSGAVVNAVILGLRQDLPKPIKEILVHTGTVHIIAISGLHLGIVAFIVLIFLKTLRIQRRLRCALTIFILFIYCILTGANIPVMRATIMATILLFGYVINRQPDIYNSLCIAVSTILFINPLGFFEVSFQLSFLSIFSLIWLSPKIKTTLTSLFLRINYSSKTGARLKYAHSFISAFSVSTACWLGLLPLIAYYFKIISPITVVANMFVVPYMVLVIACAFIFLLTGLVFPLLVSLFSPGAEISISFLLKCIYLLNRIPFGYFHLP